MVCTVKLEAINTNFKILFWDTLYLCHIKHYLLCGYLQSSINFYVLSWLLFSWSKEKSFLKSIYSNLFSYPRMTVTKSCPWLVLLGSGYSLGIYFIINFQYKLSEANLLLLSQNWGEKTQGISNRNKNFFYTFLSEFSDAHPSTFFGR